MFMFAFSPNSNISKTWHDVYKHVITCSDLLFSLDVVVATVRYGTVSSESILWHCLPLPTLQIWTVYQHQHIHFSLISLISTLHPWLLSASVVFAAAEILFADSAVHWTHTQMQYGFFGFCCFWPGLSLWSSTGYLIVKQQSACFCLLCCNILPRWSFICGPHEKLHPFGVISTYIVLHSWLKH